MSRPDRPVGVKYTHADIARSINHELEMDKRRSLFGKLMLFPARWERVRLPLEAHPRRSWGTALRANAGQWAAYWGIRFIYVAVLLVCAAVVDDKAHGGPIAMDVIIIVFMAALLLCFVKMCIWVGRANSKAMGRAWRARMTREAEERLARDDPERDW